MELESSPLNYGLDRMTEVTVCQSLKTSWLLSWSLLDHLSRGKQVPHHEERSMWNGAESGRQLCKLSHLSNGTSVRSLNGPDLVS